MQKKINEINQSRLNITVQGKNQEFIYRDITTRGIIGATAGMPVMGLTIVEGRVPDPDLEPAKLVSVGDPLMYIWHLNYNTGLA